VFAHRSRVEGIPMRGVPVGRADSPAISSGVAAALAYVRNHRERFIAELVDFVRFPSVSADPRHADDVARCAGWLAHHLRRLGATRGPVVTTSRHPGGHAGWRG